MSLCKGHNGSIMNLISLKSMAWKPVRCASHSIKLCSVVASIETMDDNNIIIISSSSGINTIPALLLMFSMKSVPIFLPLCRCLFSSNFSSLCSPHRSCSTLNVFVYRLPWKIEFISIHLFFYWIFYFDRFRFSNGFLYMRLDGLSLFILSVTPSRNAIFISVAHVTSCGNDIRSTKFYRHLMKITTTSERKKHGTRKHCGFSCEFNILSENVRRG